MIKETPSITRVSIASDEFHSGTSTEHGHNLNVIAFNLDAIVKYYPEIAVEIMAISSRLPHSRRLR